jgi:putative oxidoreductase
MKGAFDFSKPLVPVRIILGLIFIPHVLFKLADIPASTAFFAKVGFNPPGFFVWLGIAMESASAICLVLGILPKWAGLMASAVMCTAIGAVLQTKGLVWLWNFGGIEYNVVWAALCAIVAIYAWAEERATYGRSFLLFPQAA